MFESIINDEILDELLKQAGISNDTSVRKDLTPEKAASMSHFFSLTIQTDLNLVFIQNLANDVSTSA